MSQNGVNPYLRTKVLTASPEELRLMLYEGAIKFTTQARDALQKKDFETSYNALLRAQKIVLELSTSMHREQAPELCEKLAALYTFIYRRLVDANLHRDVTAVEEAIKLIAYEKQTWELLMSRSPRRAAAPPSSARSPALEQTAMSSLTARG